MTTFAARVEEFVERPLGELDDYIVDRRLEAGISGARDRVEYLVQRISDRDFGRDLCYRVTRRLGSKRGRTRNSGVDLDNGVFKAVGL